MPSAQEIVDRATAAIQQATSVEEGAKTLIATLRQTIADNNINAGPLNDVLDAFEADTTGLASALTDNTPSAPAPSDSTASS